MLILRIALISMVDHTGHRGSGEEIATRIGSKVSLDVSDFAFPVLFSEAEIGLEERIACLSNLDYHSIIRKNAQNYRGLLV